MKYGLQILLCILIAAFTIYLYIDKQNDLTALRMEIPALEQELRKVEEENTHLQYQINQFENPVHLMELAQKPEFSHLKFPYLDKIIILNVPVPVPEALGSGLQFCNFRNIANDK